MIGGIGLILKKFSALSRDLLFPVFCLSCRAEGAWLCPSCLEKLKSEMKPQFFRHPHLDGVFSLADYRQEIIDKLIHLFKYEYVEEISAVFDALIGFVIREKSFLTDVEFGDNSAVLIPVPLHKKRYVERGFNQAEILAKSLSSHLDLPMETRLLIRHRYTGTQVGLKGAERRVNLTGAFALRPLVALPRRAILVDDVFTTGSTLEEAARTLKAGGVRAVWGVVVARET